MNIYFQSVWESSAIFILREKNWSGLGAELRNKAQREFFVVCSGLSEYLLQVGFGVFVYFHLTREKICGGVV